MLQHVSDLKDLMSCTSVSKGWAKACLDIRLTALTVNSNRHRHPNSYRASFSHEAHTSASKMLYKLRQGHNLEFLQRLEIATPHTAVDSINAMCIVVLTNICPLMTFEIQAPCLGLTDILNNMAKTVQRLALDCKTTSQVRLKDFEPFSQLSTLQITARENRTCKLVLDGTARKLHTLSLAAPCCFGIDEGTCSKIAMCLPSLTGLRVTEYAKSESLHSLLSLPSLHWIDLELRAANTEGRAPVVLTVSALSHLRKIKVSGPHGLVTLVVLKPEVEVTAIGVKVVRRTATAALHRIG